MSASLLAVALAVLVIAIVVVGLVLDDGVFYTSTTTETHRVTGRIGELGEEHDGS